MSSTYNFARRLQNLLNESGHSQTELAKYLGIKSQTVSAWISGRAYPNYEKFYSIARYFRLTVPQLLSEGPPPEDAPSPSVTFIQDRDDLAEIPRGSAVKVELDTTPEVGDIVLFKNEQLLRLAAYRDKIAVLMSGNPADPPIIAKEEDREITGTATAIILKKTKKETAPDGTSEAAQAKEGNRLNSSEDILTPSGGGVKL